MIEVLIVLAILALIAGLSYPSIRNTLDQQQLDGVTRRVLAAMQYGYLQAQTRGRSQVLRFVLSPGAPGGRIEFRETAGWGCGDAADRDDDADGEVDAFDILAEDATSVVAITEIAPRGLAGEGICFKPDGRVFTTSGAVPLMDSPELASYNAPRASTVGVRLQRFASPTAGQGDGDEDAGGGQLVVTGVRSEIHLVHAGVASVNRDLGPL